jgi:hypothetical protein
MMSSGLLPQNRQLKSAFYQSSLDPLRNTPVRELIAASDASPDPHTSALSTKNPSQHTDQGYELSSLHD